MFLGKLKFFKGVIYMDLLKMDKNMFLSIVNMKLRDFFKNEKELCSYYDVELSEFYDKLNSLGLKYYEDINQIKNL